MSSFEAIHQLTLDAAVARMQWSPRDSLLGIICFDGVVHMWGGDELLPSHMTDAAKGQDGTTAAQQRKTLFEGDDDVLGPSLCLPPVDPVARACAVSVSRSSG